MADPRALVRVARRARSGRFGAKASTIATAQAIDVARAVRGRRLRATRDAFGKPSRAVVVPRAAERARFDAAFDGLLLGGAAAHARDHLGAPRRARVRCRRARRAPERSSTQLAAACAGRWSRPPTPPRARSGRSTALLVGSGRRRVASTRSSRSPARLPHAPPSRSQLGVDAARQASRSSARQPRRRPRPRGAALADALRARSSIAPRTTFRAFVRANLRRPRRVAGPRAATAASQTTPFASLRRRDRRGPSRRARVSPSACAGGARVRRRRAAADRSTRTAPCDAPCAPEACPSSSRATPAPADASAARGPLRRERLGARRSRPSCSSSPTPRRSSSSARGASSSSASSARRPSSSRASRPRRRS